MVKKRKFLGVKPDITILDKAKELFDHMIYLNEAIKIELINKLKWELHIRSPFVAEPVDYVQWVKVDQIEANDYNPNIVAPPEMKLLQHSIKEDGYTQPIVAWKKTVTYEVVDGFHRNRVGRECDAVRKRIHGYLPLAIINVDRTTRSNRIASTIRHNRARGKHRVEGMSDIVLELKNRNWKNERIARELGMDEDEILRLCQITGLADLFADEEFSKSWNVEDSETDFVSLSDEEEYGTEEFRTVNTSDENRIFHTWHKWECYKAGLYNTTKEGMTKEQCEQTYVDFLSNTKRFAKSLKYIITKWKHSCEHYLTNKAMNRIAWLGQAAVCYATGVPAVFRNGWFLLTEGQQNEANKIAFVYLNNWFVANGRDKITIEEALDGRQMDIY